MKGNYKKKKIPGECITMANCTMLGGDTHDTEFSCLFLGDVL